MKTIELALAALLVAPLLAQDPPAVPSPARAPVQAGAAVGQALPGEQLRSAYAEIPVDLKKILASKSSDAPLMPNDILFVPSSAAKSALARGLEAVAQVATYAAIDRVP